MQKARQKAARQQYEEERTQNVWQRVGEVWMASKTDCMCFGDPMVCPSPGDRDHNSPYCVCDDAGDVATVTSKCQNDECAVCILINKLDKPTLTALGLKHNNPLTAMLDMAPSMHSPWTLVRFLKLDSNSFPRPLPITGLQHNQASICGRCWLSCHVLSPSEKHAL